MEEFNKSNVVSAWIKSMRFNNYREASYWFVVLVNNDVSEKYLAKRLAIFAAEDCFEESVMLLANSVYQMYELGIGDPNMLWQVLYRCCKSKKFWEDSCGQKYELLSNEALKRYKENGIEPIPQWAIDKHTKRFYEFQSLNRHTETDIRFSRTLTGRLHMIKMFQKYSKIDPAINDESIWDEAIKQMDVEE